MKIRLYILLLLLLVSGISNASVTMRDTTITWHTFNFGLNDDFTVQWATTTHYDTLSQQFQGIVLENEYLMVTLVPEFGGRILSIIYKPTGHEQLYQNPCGAPYGIGEDWFYYTWLMVYGGIFPTMPEAEHGKAWFLPWKYEIINDSAENISIKMSWQDTVALDGINTGKWKYGITELTCDYIVTLKSGMSAVQTDITMSNGRDTELDYEYWTCLTLAPGSDPAAPATTAGAEMIIPADIIKIPSWYPQIASQEQRVPMRYGYYYLDALRMWENWSADGIAYPWDDDDVNYWGVINHDNEEGLIRVADNSVTTGIKIWAWGYDQSQNIDPFKDPGQVHRPYIELWAGHSNEFFETATIPALTDITWQEFYMPTVGLSDITHSADHALADFYTTETEGSIIAQLGFNVMHPAQAFDVEIALVGESPLSVYNNLVAYDPATGSTSVAVNLDMYNWSAGDSLICVVRDGDLVLLTAALQLGAKPTLVENESDAIADDFQLFNNYPNPFNAGTTIRYQLGSASNVKVNIYNVLGEQVASLVDDYQQAGDYRVQWQANVPSGIYYCHFEAQGPDHNHRDFHKMILIK